MTATIAHLIRLYLVMQGELSLAEKAHKLSLLKQCALFDGLGGTDKVVRAKTH